MSKILKNTTNAVVNIGDTGQSVPANGQLTIAPVDDSLYRNSSNTVTLVGDGTLIVSDGTNDLDISDGIDLIKGFFQDNINLVDGSGNSIGSIVGPQGPQGDIGPQGPAGPPGIFGSEYYYAESRGVSQTSSQNSSNPPVKVSITTGSLPSGNYRLNWTYIWSHQSTGSDFRARVTRNGSEIWYHSQEPKDSGTDQRHPVCFFDRINMAGVQTFQIEYWTENDNNESYIRDAKIELWRID